MGIERAVSVDITYYRVVEWALVGVRDLMRVYPGTHTRSFVLSLSGPEAALQRISVMAGSGREREPALEQGVPGYTL